MRCSKGLHHKTSFSGFDGNLCAEFPNARRLFFWMFNLLRNIKYASLFSVFLQELCLLQGFKKNLPKIGEIGFRYVVSVNERVAEKSFIVGNVFSTVMLVNIRNIRGF